MDISSRPSTLEILPDEILLEVCDYLLCVDILQSFFGLNLRMTRMISRYCHSVSLHKASITQSSYLCTNVLPHIGAHIRTLLIDRCYSVMQQELFMKHFSTKMSIVFPRVKKISLVAFQYHHIMAFLASLHDLNCLDELHIHDLFGINEEHQGTVLRTLLQANNHQLTSVLINNGSSCLRFSGTDCYVNIIRLRIILKTIKDIASLFAAIPYVRYLDVTLGDDDDNENKHTDEMNVCSLHHLIDFQLRSTKRWWLFEELSIVLAHLPNARTVSLFLCVTDSRLVCGDTLLLLLPSTVQQFHYAVFYAPLSLFDQYDTIVASWPSSHPIICYQSDDCGFLHTIPWYFTYMSFPTTVGKRMSSQTNLEADYDRQVKKLEVIVNKNVTFAKSLAVIAQCRRMRRLVIFINPDDENVKEEHDRVPSLPQLSQLGQVYIYASLAMNFDHLSSLFVAAPNIYRLDLPIDYLLQLLENEQTSNQLGHSIKSLVILEATKSSTLNLNEEHIRFIASTLTRLSDVYANLRHLTPSIKGGLYEIMPSSMESMVRCFLSEFQQHKLISLVFDIQPCETIVTNVNEWLAEHTILHQQEFAADFNGELNRVVIWM